MTEPFDEESLLRALRAPGSAGELADEEKYACMFRSAQTVRRRRAASRFGAGTVFVVALAVGGSAAAAYTNHLPEPIQRFAHRALGPVAPPPPEPRYHHATDHVVADSPSATPTPTPTGSAAPSPTATSPAAHSPSPTAAQSHAPAPKPTPTTAATPTPTPSPSAPPMPTPTPAVTSTPTPTPTSTPTLVPVVPAALSISGSTHKAEAGEAVAFSGAVTSADGSAVRRVRVALQTFSDGWSTVATGRTDASGAVSLVLPPVPATTAVRLRTTNGVHSSRWRVTLHPELSITSSPAADNGTVAISVAALGAQPGDRVQLLSKAGQVATGTLDTDGTVSFTITPTAKRTRYVVQLPRTSSHGADHASITVVVKKPASP